MAGSGSVTDEMEADIFSYIDEADSGAGEPNAYGSENVGSDDPHAYVQIVDGSNQNNTQQQAQTQNGQEQTQQVQQPQGQQNNQQQQQQQANPQLTKLQDGSYRDNKGNVTDAQGNILATRGSERRIYEKAQRVEAAYQDSQRQVQELQTQLQQGQVLNGMPQRLNLANEEVQLGLTLAAEFKANPVEAAKKIVAMAVQQGHNVTDILGSDVGNSVDMVAITNLINDKLSPITSQYEQQQQEQQLDRQARIAYNEFLADFPDAVHHSDAIKTVIDKGHAKTVREAYLMVQNFAARHGLNMNSPLGEQLQAKDPNAFRAQGNGAQNPQQQQQVQQRNQSPANPRPMLNGGTSSNDVVSNQTQQADPNASWDSIVRGEMGLYAN